MEITVNAPRENQPLVSVIMPFYRQDAYLLEAVESVKAQTYRDWELIVVDDGSDGRPAGEILQDACLDLPVVVCRHEANQGVSAAKNTAFAASKGELIVPVDSDDVLAPAYLQKMVDALLSTGADGIYCDFEKFGLQNYTRCTETNAIRILSGWFPPNPVLMKRGAFEAIGGYDTNFDLGEDACLWITAYRLGMKFAHLHEPLYRYRSHLESGTMRRGQDYPLILSKLVRKFPELYADHAIEIVDGLADHWVQDIKTHSNLLSEFATLENEYKHLHGEFHKLLERAQAAHSEPESIRMIWDRLWRQVGMRLNLKSAALKGSGK